MTRERGRSRQNTALPYYGYLFHPTLPLLQLVRNSAFVWGVQAAFRVKEASADLLGVKPAIGKVENQPASRA